MMVDMSIVPQSPSHYPARILYVETSIEAFSIRRASLLRQGAYSHKPDV